MPLEHVLDKRLRMYTHTRRRAHTRTHTIKVVQLAVQLVGHTSKI